ncbi:MAG: hypothetical protein P8077_06185, partial [Gammaproteobacteria bacterium]
FCFVLGIRGDGGDLNMVAGLLWCFTFAMFYTFEVFKSRLSVSVESVLFVESIAHQACADRDAVLEN